MTTSPAPARLLVRPSGPGDLAAVTAIYAWHAEHGSGTFELEGPGLDEMTRRRDDVLAKGLPWLVAERSGQIVGYAYANHFRPRLAYRFSLEDSVYVAPAAQGQGIGRLLLAELLARCEARGARQMFAVIGDGSNAASIGVHRALGFTDVGVMRAAGWKFDRWLDVVILQRRLGLGEHAAPLEPSKAGPMIKSKTLATWLAFLGGSLGLHRIYLHGQRDVLGWLHVFPTSLGTYGVIRMQEFGQDDRLAWALIPLLGLVLAGSMLEAIVYGLTPDDTWNARFNPHAPAPRSGWGPIFGVIGALIVGSTVLIATIAFSGQRYFESQIEQAKQISQ